jgi:DNA modification methylase
MSQLRIEYVPLSSLQIAARNPKKHALDQLGGSISRFGYVEPIIIDERTGRMVAGHGRRETLLRMRDSGEQPPTGVTQKDNDWFVPVVRGWASKSDKDAEAYLLASNRHVELGGWDDPELAKLLQEIDLEGTGFTQDDLIELLDATAEPVELQGDPDEVPDEPDDANVYVVKGDLYRLGKHLILCGDSTDPEHVRALMGDQFADICWTDPPWNVAYGKSDHPSYKKREIANDDLGAAFPGFCAAFCASIKAATKPGAALYMAMSAQEWPTIDGALRHVGFHWSATVIWAKDSLVLGRGDYHRQYEPIWYGWNEDAPRLHPLEDRKQSDLWNIPRPKRSEEHPTMKPVELVVRSLQNSSSHGAIVFEPFSGSGTTLVACEQTHRVCRAIELEPKYVQVAIDRWQSLTGKKAVREGNIHE